MIRFQNTTLNTTIASINVVAVLVASYQVVIPGASLPAANASIELQVMKMPSITSPSLYSAIFEMDS
jgi:hypothetical protein